MLLTETQRMLLDSLDRFLVAAHPAQATLPYEAAAALWNDFAARLGIVALPFAEDRGGLDGSPLDTMVVVERLGYALAAEPYQSSAVAVAALLNACDSVEARELAAGAASGAVRLVVALGEASVLRSTTANRQLRLDGSAGLVACAPSADGVLVQARAEDGLARLCLVPFGAPGVAWTDRRLLDGSLVSNLTCGGVHPALACEIAAPVATFARDARRAARCAELVGVAQAMLDQTVAYTIQRRQFGKALSEFQVLQHRMAAMHVEVELARSMALMAACAMRLSDSDRQRQLAAAMARVLKAARTVGHSAVQLHGGVGTTAELPLGRYLKRVRTALSLYGTSQAHATTGVDHADAAGSDGATPTRPRAGLPAGER